MIFADSGAFRDGGTTTPSAFDRLVAPVAYAEWCEHGTWTEWVGPRLTTF